MRDNHHYVPQFYLKGFESQENYVFVYNKKNGKRFKSSVRNICSEFDFFAFDAGALPDDENLLEKELSKMEGNIAQLMSIIRTQSSFESLHADEIDLLLEWIAWIYIANPTYRAMLITMWSKSTKMQPNNTDILILFVKNHEKIFQDFRKRAWQYCVISPSQGSLITSDRPVNLLGKTVSGVVGLENGILYFPLSPHLLLLSNKIGACGFGRKPNNIDSASQCKISNILTCLKSDRLLISNDETVFDDVSELSIWLSSGIRNVPCVEYDETLHVIKCINM